MIKDIIVAHYFPPWSPPNASLSEVTSTRVHSRVYFVLGDTGPSATLVPSLTSQACQIGLKKTCVRHEVGKTIRVDYICNVHMVPCCLQRFADYEFAPNAPSLSL